MGSAEVVLPGHVNELRSQLQRLALEHANISYAIQQVARLASFHLLLLGDVFMKDVIQTGFTIFDATPARGAREYLRVRRGSRWFNSRPIAHAPQESLIR